MDSALQQTLVDAASTLEDTPFVPLFADVEQVVTTAFILPLRHRRTGVRLDVAIGMSGFEQDVVRRATTGDVGGAPVPVATVEDLLVMKALAGRPQDDVDIRGLVAAGKATIDWGRCLAVADALGSAIDLDIAARLRAAQTFGRWRGSAQMAHRHRHKLQCFAAACRRRGMFETRSGTS